MFHTTVACTPHTARVSSYNRHGELEWSRTLVAANKAAAMRKAWVVVADCGAAREDCKVTEGECATLVDVGAP